MMTTTMTTSSLSGLCTMVLIGLMVCVSPNVASAFSVLSMSSTPPLQFPASTRQALLQKAQELKQSQGCYSASGWSNRLGSVITPAAVPGVYTADRPFYWNKIDVGCRMTIIEIPSDDDKKKPDLWIHSPVALDGPLMQTLDELGTVKYVVSPNYEHVKFAPQWAQAYPDAELWACPGLMEKTNPNYYTHEIPYGTACTELWPSIQALHVDCEVNPFTGNPFFNEGVFYHTPSKTLLTTDLYWNYPQNDGIPNSNLASTENGPWELAPRVDSIPVGSKLWKFGMDQVYSPFYQKFMVNDKTKFQTVVVDTILHQWNIDTVIPAHGDLIRGTNVIQGVLKRHFGVES